MYDGGLLLPLALGAALLALWSYVRWPDVAPKSFGRAIVFVLLAFGLLQLGTLPLDAAVGASPGLVVLALLGVILPVLTFAFLAALWVMRLFADAIKGYV
jgi:hypothetical protein